MSFGRVGWLKFSDKPYMTGPERGEFRRLRDGDAVTIFGVQTCAAEGCENEVPRGVKTYCSQACWQKEEGRTDEKEEAESGSMD